MFDIGATELLLIVIVAILVIGPKDMPLAMRTAGRWIGKIRKLSGHFRAGLDAMVREAELEDMEKKWKAQNEKIMREHPGGSPDEMEPTGAYPPKQGEGARDRERQPGSEKDRAPGGAEAAVRNADEAQPSLDLPPPDMGTEKATKGRKSPDGDES
ncbi:Sec-independent protein translocase protein TatB [Aurantiacibacter poecillastricola]|uniref:Sec-independent protein translocase protein TatB n=1 Tax=Aurantiacibacter poecillastricola TaxID=3064385 RepID=UPI00273DF960|nr:Sec-independent protein translocase protein TatB [Aurantiacibacter sp. 219JJ12-13]MDP5262844.1 Sec-independent protein translocase protein TatB [Aurantiacibacter sp. 219JJ12-13]